MPLPFRLYKYEAMSIRALQNLKGQIIYFGSPLNFNDPYDCATTPHIEVPNDDEVEHVRRHYQNDIRPGQAERDRLVTMPRDELRAVLVRAAEKALRSAIEDFLKTKGVACFSEVSDNLLMWSHYGGQYKGFCLEFASDSQALEKVQPVTYSASLPIVKVSTMLVDRTFDPVVGLFATKASAWSYEREWRCIHSVAGTQFIYEARDLTGVYFGPDMDQQSLEIICLILSGQNDTVQFWRGKRSASEFRVEFEPFTYTSHLEAKRKGLL